MIDVITSYIFISSQSSFIILVYIHLDNIMLVDISLFIVPHKVPVIVRVVWRVENVQYEQEVLDPQDSMTIQMHPSWNASGTASLNLF